MTRRLDQLLVQRGLAESRARAKAAIEAGRVTVDGAPAKAASQPVAEDAVVTYADAHRWVGRGALKLDHALTLWPVPVEGRTVLDVGASTGGFTEVCLDRGAARVFAVDVGSGQMHPRVAADPRVISLERTDARDLTPALIPEAPQLIVCDASFIGLAKVLPAALSLAGVIDLAAERTRLEKEIAAFDSDIGHVNKKLGNPNFVARAAPEVVDEQREKLAEAEAGKARLQAALARLDAVG